MSENTAGPDTRSRFRWWGPVSGLGLTVAFLTCVIDQAHKWWMLDVFQIKERGRVTVTPFLDLVYAKNTGISYGTDLGLGQGPLVAIAVLAFCGLGLWLAYNGTRLVAWSLGLIMGGAIGNAIDRITQGGVSDFFSFHAYGYYWYVFNIADVAIVAGVVGLLYDAVFAHEERAHKRT
ncbi:MAG: signal peptidase II [Pseudomonadota bacterium]